MSSRPPDLVLGTAPLAGLYEETSDEAARATLESAWASGVRRFDTAPHYGTGLAEERLGTFLRGVPSAEAHISTKVGRSLVEDAEAPAGAFVARGGRRSRFDFRRDAVLAQFEDSCVRLGVSRVDTVFLHDPDAHLALAVGEAVPALEELRSGGAVDRIGVGTNDPATALALLAHVPLDVVMIAGRITLLDDSAVAELVPRCAELGVELHAAGVFNGGILADPGEGARYDYRPAPARVLALAREMAAACAEHGVALRDAALQHPARHGVDAVVVGVRSPEELAQLQAGRARSIPAELWARLDALRAGDR